MLDAIGMDNRPTIFPNPSTGTFSLSFELLNLREVKLTIVNLSGETVLHNDLGMIAGKFNKTIDASHLSEGVYLIKLAVGDRIYYNKILFR